MQGLPDEDISFNFKDLFSPLTTTKAIIWIIVIGLIVYANMLFNGFVLDDKTYILNNPEVHSLNIPYFFGQNTFNTVGQYRPLVAIYLAVLYTVFGPTPFFFHTFQLLLHIIVSILVYYFFKKFFSNGYSLFLALVFLVHPIQVESVSYIAQTTSPLFFIFGIIALLFSTKKTLTLKSYVIIFFLLLLSVLTKETGILFILLIVFYRLLFAKNNLYKFLSGSFITFVIYLYSRYFIGHVGLSARQYTPIANLTLFERLLNVPKIIFYYLNTFFFPQKLAVVQQWVVTSINVTTFYLPLLVDVLFFTFMGYIGLLLYKKDNKDFRIFLFFALWFLLALGFHLQIFPLDMTVADRWFYFPIVGLLGMIGISLKLISSKSHSFKKISYIIAVSILILLSLRTMIRNTNWVDAITLYKHDILVSDNFDIEIALGNEYANIKDYNDALKHFYKSNSQNPNEINLQDIGSVYFQIGDSKNAIKYFGMALHAKNYGYFQHKYSIEFYQNYAYLLVFSNQPNKADNVIKSALKDYPDTTNAGLWALLALTKTELKERQAAIDAATKAYQLDPTDQQINFIYNKIINNQPFSLTVKGKSYKFGYSESGATKKNNN